MKKLILVMAASLPLFSACAGAPKAGDNPVQTPKSILPNHGMTESRAKGLGDAAKFAK